MKRAALLFDLDGTLLDTLEDLRDAVNYALGTVDCPERSLPEIRKFVGDGAALLIQRALAGTGKESCAGEVLTAFKAYYETHSRIKTKPYDGIMDVLRELKAKGYLLAMVSNKPDVSVQILNQYYFNGIFEVAMGERAGIPRKPAADMPLLAAKQLGAVATDCIYIGDSEVDVRTARNAGMTCLSVTWGFRDESVMASEGSVHFCRRVQDLAETIQQLEADIIGK